MNRISNLVLKSSGGSIATSYGQCYDSFMGNAGISNSNSYNIAVFRAQLSIFRLEKDQARVLASFAKSMGMIVVEMRKATEDELQQNLNKRSEARYNYMVTVRKTTNHWRIRMFVKVVRLMTISGTNNDYGNRIMEAYLAGMSPFQAITAAAFDGVNRSGYDPIYIYKTGNATDTVPLLQTRRQVKRSVTIFTMEMAGNNKTMLSRILGIYPIMPGVPPSFTREGSHDHVVSTQSKTVDYSTAERLLRANNFQELFYLLGGQGTLVPRLTGKTSKRPITERQRT